MAVEGDRRRRSPWPRASAATRSSSARWPWWTAVEHPHGDQRRPQVPGNGCQPVVPRCTVTPAPPWGGAAGAVLDDGDQAAVGADGGHRVAAAGRVEGAAGGQGGRLGRGQGLDRRRVHRRRRVEHRRHQPPLAGEVLQAVGGGLGEPADGRAPQAGQVGQGAGGPAQVGGQRADVGPARADHPDGGQRPPLAAEAEQLQRVDHDRAGRPLDLLPAGLGVQTLPADLDRRHHRRDLFLGADEAGHGGPQARLVDLEASAVAVTVPAASRVSVSAPKATVAR